MDTTDSAYTANMTPPDPPSKTQQRTVQGGRTLWHIQTPFCSLAAYFTVTRTQLWQKMVPGLGNRQILAFVAAASLPIVGWDVWYYERAERAVNERAAWERAQRMMRTKAMQASTPASSEDDMGDPWA